jgi:hypothetical protein
MEKRHSLSPSGLEGPRLLIGPDPSPEHSARRTAVMEGLPQKMLRRHLVSLILRALEGAA